MKKILNMKKEEFIDYVKSNFNDFDENESLYLDFYKDIKVLDENNKKLISNEISYNMFNIYLREFFFYYESLEIIKEDFRKIREEMFEYEMYIDYYMHNIHNSSYEEFNLKEDFLENI